jgi:glycosyltransferase involved in cell wall biosynthesis
VKIGYFIGNTGISGGVKVILQHVRLLRELGHDALLLTNRIVDDWARVPCNTLVVREDLGDLPRCDLYVATVASEVRMLHSREGLRVAHLCQSYEPEGYRARLAGESETEKYRVKGLFSFLKRADNNRHFRKRIRAYRATYALPTIKMAVSGHLAGIVEREYSQRCFLVQNGVDGTVFHPGAGDRRHTSGSGTVKILSSGSIHVGAKGIPDTLTAVKLLKDRGFPVELTRVSPGPPSDEEERSGVVDRFLVAISEEKMAEAYRESDVFVSTSLEGEGFGLPAIEAMCTGIPCVLTEISAYRGFGTNGDFACFVPTHRPDAVAEAIMGLRDNVALAERCVERGLEVARAFSLEKTKEHLAAFAKGISQ